MKNPYNVSIVGPLILPWTGTPISPGFSFWTDEHGDEHIITPNTNPTLEVLESTGTEIEHTKNQLYDGVLPGETPVYETD
jgi:hypothetical protein